ncbi:MAG: hypothetical protein ACKOZU_04225 [Planctomycetaceae bacterium]
MLGIVVAAWGFFPTKSIRIAAAVLLYGAAVGAPAPAAERFVWFGASTRPG